MPYVKKDKDGNIIEIYAAEQEGMNLEFIEDSNVKLYSPKSKNDALKLEAYAALSDPLFIYYSALKETGADDKKVEAAKTAWLDKRQEVKDRFK